MTWGTIALLVIYITPWLVASFRGMPNSGSVFVINVFLGWTIIGWVVALAMAMGNNHKGPQYR